MKTMVTLNSIVSATNGSCSRQGRHKAFVMVGRELVWDYKILGGKLRLISEPQPDLPSSEYVTFGEISDYVNKEYPDGRDMPLVSESTGEELGNFEVLVGENEQLYINLILE